MKRPLKLFGGTCNPKLVQEIADSLGVELRGAELTRFADSEVSFQITENVRGADVFVVQPTGPPVNEHLMELLVMIDAFKRASASRITAVLPYYGYARQDRKERPRVPISAKLVADLISTAGTSRVITMDLHAGQIQGFFNIPVDHLFAAPVMLERVTSLGLQRLVIVSPDAGGVERARAYAKRLRVALAVMDKRRGGNNEVETIHVIGDVVGKTALIVDDIVDSAGTLVKAVEALREAGADRVLACCTHPVLSGPAVERIEDSSIEKLIVSNTIPLRPNARACDKIEVLSVARLLGEAILSVHDETSVSKLFV
ncbi:MAG TPA: ribose-phosphate pyrophosphokinase [Vicinamibacteria bacterium]|nr:ribose-phosphate pyrophosphokinase [Vicinamibacteria bacterium]